MGKVLPLLIALIGLGAGISGGIMLRPVPAENPQLGSCGEDQPASGSGAQEHSGEEPPNVAGLDYVKINNQFVVPVVQGGSVKSLVVLSLSLEMTSGGPELVYQKEPKLRDAFLQVLFNHANTGGFDGHFTSGNKMESLRNALRESATKVLGPVVSNVLVVDVARQDS